MQSKAILNLAGARDFQPGMPAIDSRFFVRHVMWPLIAFLVMLTVLVPMGGDFWIADRLYAWEGHQWALQQHPFAQSLIHVAGRDASRVLWFCMALLFFVSLARPRWRTGWKPLGYLLVTTLLSVAVISALKRATHMDCPWDVMRYGGARPFIGLFSARPASLPDGRCFPAGHASAGYAWVALYFFLLTVRPSLRRWGLGIGLAIGLVFGFAQQLRGAHFLSHDLTTLAICWAISLLLYRVMLAPRRTPASASLATMPPARLCQENGA